MALLLKEERELSGLEQSFKKQRTETQLSTMMSFHNSRWREI